MAGETPFRGADIREEGVGLDVRLTGRCSAASNVHIAIGVTRLCRGFAVKFPAAYGAEWKASSRHQRYSSIWATLVSSLS